MASVKSLCKSGVVLHNGSILKLGTADECVDYYLSNNISEFVNYVETDDSYRGGGTMRELEYISVRMLNDVENMSTEEPMEFEMVIKRNVMSIKQCQFGIVIRDNSDTPVGASYSDPVQLPDGVEIMRVRVSFPHHQLTRGRYYLNFNMSNFDYSSVIRDYDVVHKVISFEVRYVDAAHTRPFVIWPSLGGCAYRDSKVLVEAINASK